MALSSALARCLHEPSVAHLERLLKQHCPLDQAASCLNVRADDMFELLGSLVALESDPHVLSRVLHDEQGAEPGHNVPESDLTSESLRLGPGNAPFEPVDVRQTKPWQDTLKQVLRDTPDLPEELIVAIRTFAPSDPALKKVAALLPGIGWHEERVLAQSELPTHIHELSFELQVVLAKNLRRIERGRALAQAAIAASLAKQAEAGSIRALTFMLERTDPRNWGPTSTRGPQASNPSPYAPVPRVAGNQGPNGAKPLSGLSDEELRRRVEELMKT